MIEVEGAEDSKGDIPLYMSFDGKIFEIICLDGMHTAVARYPINWLKEMEIEENGDNRRTLKYTMNYPAPTGFFTFVSGGENLDELVNAVNAATNTF
jgi:hypothetical protein